MLQFYRNSLPSIAREIFAIFLLVADPPSLTSVNNFPFSFSHTESFVMLSSRDWSTSISTRKCFSRAWRIKQTLILRNSRLSSATGRLMTSTASRDSLPNESAIETHSVVSLINGVLLSRESNLPSYKSSKSSLASTKP